MSHFLIMVINTNGSKEYEDILAPFSENLEVDPYWVEKDPEYFIKHYTSVNKDYSKLVDGVHPTVDYTGNIGKSLKDLFDMYHKDYWDDEELKYENGKIYRKTTYNPLSKWDWYQLGGRWAGFLKLKSRISELSKAFGDVVEPNFSFGWNAKEKEERSDGTNVDMAVNKHIDWEFMMAKAGERGKVEWEKAAAVLGTKDNKVRQPKYSWDDMIQKYKEDYQRAREEYWDQPLLKKLMKSREVTGSIEDYNYTLEEYIKRTKNNAISTFAVVLDGEWIEKGKMGWFGLSSDTKEESESWNQGFYDKFIKDLNPEAMIIMVDCHI